MTKTTNDKLKELFKGTVFENYEYKDFDNADDVIESLKEQINEDEIIYYSTAMNYLRENDASLKNSLELAGEFGYSIKDVNSELLATLLYQSSLIEELNELEPQIDECFNEEREGNND